jgi:hypothetical protein
VSRSDDLAVVDEQIKLSMAARRGACYPRTQPARTLRPAECQRPGKLNRIDASNHFESPDTTQIPSAQVGAKRHDGFDTSAAADVHRLGCRNRQDHGTQGCVAARSRLHFRAGHYDSAPDLKRYVVGMLASRGFQPAYIARESMH